MLHAFEQWNGNVSAPHVHEPSPQLPPLRAVQSQVIFFSPLVQVYSSNVMHVEMPLPPPLEPPLFW
jgi:hypothetical protein